MAQIERGRVFCETRRGLLDPLPIKRPKTLTSSEAVMNPARSLPTASIELASPRKRDLLEHFETNSDELDRWREFNAAYHDDDRKFMRFLIPPGKRVLELGCSRGD